MRRVSVPTLVFVSLLLSSVHSVNLLVEVSPSAVFASPAEKSLNAALPLPNSCAVSPPGSSPPSVAYVTNTSDIAYWQRSFANRVNETRLLGLLISLSSFDCRHPFNTDGNASIEFVTSYLTSMGLPYTSDWFLISKELWTGSEYVYQNYWTRNLYLTPWEVNPSASTLIVTCHLDSARHGLLGMSTTNAPGANDNAAGIASILEALQVLARSSESSQNWNVLIAFLGGEEGNGTLSLLGSRQLISHGLETLAINPSTSFVLNIDEVAYQGTISPSILALYRYLDDEITLLQLPLAMTSENLNIKLIDTQNPRATNLAAIQSDAGWCISEWAFYTNHIPSLTISTSPYPDPYKHTIYDGISHCSLVNIVNTTKLLIGLILALAVDLPVNSPNNAAAWIPILSRAANITTTDYLDPSLSTYQALVLDPLITLDASVTAQLLHASLPLLLLGNAGAYFLQLSNGLSVTTQGILALQVQGLKAFHPVIQSPWLLENENAQLFRNCSTVHAVSSTSASLILVGNSTWCSLVYLPPPLMKIPTLFLGLDLPESQISRQICAQGLAWLLDNSPDGVCLGVNQQAPSVGDSLLLNIFVGNLANWTGHPNEAIRLNITVLGSSEEYHLITNETGIAQLELFLKTPTQYCVKAQSTSGLESFYTLTPLSVCSATLQYPHSIKQGERLSVFCYINSSWDTSAYINLSLFAEEVGAVFKPSLLLIPGENFFHLNLEIPPSCPPQTYNLTLFIHAPPLILFTDQFPLQVQTAFILTIIELPDNTLQNQPFPLTVNLTNLGSQGRSFEIVANPNFVGATQVIIQSNETRSVTFLIQYIPQTVIDTGFRQLSLTLLSMNQQILTIENTLFIGYAIVNLVITFLPPIFLCGLCILGIFWLRNGKRSQQQTRSEASAPPITIPSNEQIIQIQLGTDSEETRTQLPINPQVKQQLSQVIQKLKLAKTGSKYYSNDRIVLAWEKKGQELHIVLQGENHQLIQQLFKLLSDSTLFQTQQGDSTDF